MLRKLGTFVVAAVLVLSLAPRASAQTIGANEVMFHWGTVHPAAGQALIFNFELTDHFGEPMTVPVELRLEDKNGNAIYSRTEMVSSGHAISFAIGPDIRLARTTIGADIYAAIGPEFRTIQPCIRVLFPAGSNAVDRMTPTLEVMDVLTGRIVDFANNPHAIIGVLAQ